MNQGIHNQKSFLFLGIKEKDDIQWHTHTRTHTYDDDNKAKKTTSTQMNASCCHFVPFFLHRCCCSHIQIFVLKTTSPVKNLHNCVCMCLYVRKYSKVVRLLLFFVCEHWWTMLMSLWRGIILSFFFLYTSSHQKTGQWYFTL